MTDTHNIHTIQGYQKVYQGPLLLGAMGKNEMTLSEKPKLIWNAASKSVVVNPDNVTLTPINDVIDNMYDRQTYKRQVLWKK